MSPREGRGEKAAIPLIKGGSTALSGRPTRLLRQGGQVQDTSEAAGADAGGGRDRYCVKQKANDDGDDGGFGPTLRCRLPLFTNL